MRRIILTGAPGAGKTALLRRLEIGGYGVVEEAATDVIALEQARGIDEPWKDERFTDTILHLQRQREWQAGLLPASIVFSDRSPICTYALALVLGHRPSGALETEIARIVRAKPYEQRVMLLEHLGHIAPTPARRINYEDAMKFERVHIETYQRFGFDLVRIPKGDVDERFRFVIASVG